ncbi:MAG: hypothetical protein ACETV1_03990, partial [Candidatus Bathyarchaeia archaeon]
MEKTSIVFFTQRVRRMVKIDTGEIREKALQNLEQLAQEAHTRARYCPRTVLLPLGGLGEKGLKPGLFLTTGFPSLWTGRDLNIRYPHGEMNIHLRYPHG